MRLALLLACLSFALPAAAQYDGPALGACQSYAEKESAHKGDDGQKVVLLRDEALFYDKYAGKVGSQPVAAILTGNGAVVFDNAPSAELSFICLLANDKRPVFFSWLPRKNVSALAQCTRDEKLRTSPEECLEVLLRVAEADLTQMYAQRFQEANAQGEAQLAAFRKANEEWREYRDAECARQRERAPEGVSPAHYELACRVDVTRRRGLDVR